MRKDRRGFDRERQVVRRRRRELGGSVVDRLDKRDEASRGMDGSKSIEALASPSNHFRRRCGSSDGGREGRVSSEISRGGESIRCGAPSAITTFCSSSVFSFFVLHIVAVCGGPLSKALMKPLAEKYSRRNGPRRGGLMIVASTLGVALENARLVVRELRVENRRRQLKHIESGSSNLIRAGMGRRIIVVV